MCTPILAAGLALGQGVVQYQQVSAQAEAQQAMYNNQALADERNAAIQAKKNEQVAEAYAGQEAKLASRARLARGQAAAQYGAAGLDASMGSGLDALGSIDLAYEQDKMNLLINQRNDNFEGRIGQANFVDSANANRAAAKNVAEQSKLAKFATILGTATNVAGTFLKYGSSSGGGSSSSGGGSSGGGYTPNFYSGSNSPTNYFSNTRQNMSKFGMGVGGWYR